MRRLKQTMIMLPMAVLPLVAVAGHDVRAETVSPMHAVELLAQSKAADSKCRFLDDGDHQELADFAARGEIAAAQREGAQAATQAVRSGRSRGEAVLCGADARAEVEGTLRAARQAVASADLRPSIQPDIALEKKPEPIVVAAVSRPKNTSTPTFTTREDRLGGYGKQAMAYYVERRCMHLSRGETNDFWQLIVARHKIALARYGAGAVKAALRQAEAAASDKPCNSQSAALVKNSYAALSR